jgi:hypothetical protein
MVAHSKNMHGFSGCEAGTDGIGSCRGLISETAGALVREK